MSHEFAIDFIEAKKELLYLAGIALSEISAPAKFSQLNQYQKKTQQKLATVDLQLEAIIVDGEPVEQIEADSAAMIAISGDWQTIITSAQKLGWRSKSGRLLRTSDIVLTLSDE